MPKLASIVYGAKGEIIVDDIDSISYYFSTVFALLLIRPWLIIFVGRSQWEMQTQVLPAQRYHPKCILSTF